MSQQILLRRGLRTDLPQPLAEGELGYTTDSKELYLGTSGGNIRLANAIEIGSGGSAVVGGVDNYNTESIGELFAPPGNYNAWTPNGVQYDKTRKKFVGIINAADAHVFTVVPHYFYTVDPETLVASEPVKIVPKDSQGNPVTFATESAGSAFTVLSDGSYIYFRKGADALTYNRIKSTDGGNTWVDQGAIIIDVPWTSSYTFWGVYQTSTGRLIASLGGSSITKGKIMYSDDSGANWKVATIGGAIITGNVTAAEPCIFEVSPNNLISIARKSTSGLSYGTTGGATDPALIAYSTDNGVTWGSGYKDSTSMPDMNASDAAAVVHNGIVELFIGSRYYTTTSNVNTGQTGAIYHYSATIANALQDAFTFKGVVAYANASDSVDFHSPCASVDDKNRLLLCYMDQSSYPQADVSHWFVRGQLGNNHYVSKDGSKSIFKYSGKYIETLVSNLMTEIASLQYKVAQISGVTNPVPVPKGTLIWTKAYNAQSEQIKLDVDTDFTMKNFANTASGYDDLMTDANGITYTRYNASFAVADVTTKKNFAIYYKGTIGNQVNLPVAAAIVNGVGYGLHSVGDYGIDPTQINEYRFEYWNGVMKGYVNGLEVTVKTFTYDSTHVINYTQVSTAIGTLDNTKNYLISGGAGNGTGVYEIKMGNWD